jgi:phosphate/phosphite/phosphonate ABC transporter binding protein
MRHAIALLIALAACTPDTSPQPDVRSGWPSKLVFGVTPYYTPHHLRSEQGRLAQYLGERVGLATEYRVTKSYADLSRQITANLVHVADLAPLNYVRAKTENPELIVLATPITAGSASYNAVIVTHEDTGITSVEQLRGRHFGFVDRRSASGFLYPTAYLLALGHQPERFFSSMEFTGSHDELFKMVISGEVAAGATFARNKEMMAAEKMRVLAVTGRIPQNAFCANPKLPTALVEELRKALLDLDPNTDRGRYVLGPTPISGFARVDDSQYDEVRRVTRLVDPRSAP